MECLVRVADYLEQCTLLHSGAIMPHIERIPDEVAHVHGYYASVKNSSKIIKGVVREREKAKDCVRMVAAIAGGEEALRRCPSIFTTCNVNSPLQFPVEQTVGLIEYAKMGLPVDIAAEPQSGVAAPVTLAALVKPSFVGLIGLAGSIRGWIRLKVTLSPGESFCFWPASLH